MKKFLYTAFMFFAMGATFVACREDAETGLNPAEVDEQAQVAGTYEGEWMRVLDTDTIVEVGTLTLVPTDSAWCVDVIVSCPAIGLDDGLKSVANIAKEASYGFVFYNNSTENGLGANNFRGYVRYDADNNEIATINFVKTVKSGRKSYDYTFSFSGSLTE